MRNRQLPKVKLSALSSYVPEKIINNDDIMKAFGSSSPGTLLFRAVGAKEKRVCEENESGSDMIANVGRALLNQTGYSKESIDKLICSCDPGDHAAPDSAVVAQSKIGLVCPAFGVSMSCVGWICGVNIATQFIAGGDSRVMVIGSSTVGSKMSFANPMHRAIFGDGAAGAIIEAADVGQILSIDVFSIGEYYSKIFASYPWTRQPSEIPPKYENAFYMHPDNRLFFDALDKHIRPFYEKQFLDANVKTEEIDVFIVHQASMPLFNHTVESFNIPRNRVVDSYAEYGNTISAELPMLLDINIKNGRISKGSLVYLLTYGAGFTAGAMILKI